MKKIFILSAFLSITLCIFAKKVDLQTAQRAAQSFIVQKHTTVTKNGRHLKMAQNAEILHTVSEATPEFYVFNRKDSAGFVIISADNRVVPVLGYADSGTFDPANIPPNAQKMVRKLQAGNSLCHSQ
ncbi:MAG: Spi family protease inhibitor [Prevotella sp.]|jgi:hypothetical protein|nr:Spi family protease inhibitor [Prevotella sp.]